MKFAIGLWQSHPIDPAFVGAAFMQEFAGVAEEVGFSGLYFTEHPVPGDSWLASGGHDAVDPFVALSFVAASSSELRLLTNLTVLPYRNPFLLAKSVATLDQLSGGRVILGVGTGYLRAEYDAMGVDFDERNALFDESIEVCRKAWSGRSVEHEGIHFAARGVTALPTPVQDPLPVWVGGNSTLSLRRVAERADGWMPLLNPKAVAARRRSPELETLDQLEVYMTRLRSLREKAGRAGDPLDVLWTNLDGPPGDAWDSERFFTDIERMRTIGVTWTAINCASRTPAEAIEFVRNFGRLVIEPLRDRG
jgi:probable F420-dependent oxidoreductase